MLKLAAEELRDRLGNVDADCALILGSGWGEAVSGFEVITTLDYADIPHLGATQVKGHGGRLLVGQIGGVTALVFQGRRHWYEGVGWEPVVFPVFVSQAMRAPVMLITNAAGGIRPSFNAGTLMIIEDHINAMGTNPLIGVAGKLTKEQFPDQSRLYDPALRATLTQASQATGVKLTSGVYLAATGPAYETPAEVRAFQMMGADAVGMSTVPEAMLANALGIRVAGLSCISNKAAGTQDEALSHEDVVDATRKSMPSMRALLEAWCPLVVSAR